MLPYKTSSLLLPPCFTSPLRIPPPPLRYRRRLARSTKNFSPRAGSSGVQPQHRLRRGRDGSPHHGGVRAGGLRQGSQGALRKGPHNAAEGQGATTWVDGLAEVISKSCGASSCMHCSHAGGGRRRAFDFSANMDYPCAGRSRGREVGSSWIWVWVGGEMDTSRSIGSCLTSDHHRVREHQRG